MKEARTHRVPLMLTISEVEAITEFRWEIRARTQSDAIRRLINIGLECSRSEGPEAATGAEFGDQAPAAAGNRAALQGSAIINPDV